MKYDCLISKQQEENLEDNTSNENGQKSGKEDKKDNTDNASGSSGGQNINSEGQNNNSESGTSAEGVKNNSEAGDSNSGTCESSDGEAGKKYEDGARNDAQDQNTNSDGKSLGGELTEAQSDKDITGDKKLSTGEDSVNAAVSGDAAKEIHEDAPVSTGNGEG